MKSYLKALLLFLLCGCTSKEVYLSTLENTQNFSSTTNDADKIDSVNQETKAFAEKCEREHLICCINVSEKNVEFKGGTSKFREVLFNNFKLPKNAKAGENRIRVTIGKENNLESIEILEYTDVNTKKAIEEVFKIKELNQWISATDYGIPLKTQFEISIFIVKTRTR